MQSGLLDITWDILSIRKMLNSKMNACFNKAVLAYGRDYIDTYHFSVMRKGV